VASKRTEFVRRRAALGFTQESLAEHVGVDRSTIARWEGGKGDPRPSQRPVLAEALQVSLAELQRLLDMLSVDQPTAGGGTGRYPRRVDLGTVGMLRTAHLGLVDRYDQMPSASLLAEAGQQLTDFTRLAASAPASRVQRELLTLQAESATLMGQLVWDASQRRDHLTARRYYGQAVDLARQLRNPTLEGYALLRTAYVALYGTRDPVAGLELSSLAARTASVTSPALTGMALLHVGEAQAMLGQPVECERTLARAEVLLAEVDPADAAANLLSPGQFGRLAGSCYLELGDYRRAQQILEATADELASSRKLRPLVLGNLSLSFIRQREIDAAIETLTRIRR